MIEGVKSQKYFTDIFPDVASVELTGWANCICSNIGLMFVGEGERETSEG